MNPYALVRRPAFLQPFARWDKLRGERIALTGHRGTLGSLLVERFAAAGVNVMTFTGDIRDINSVDSWLGSCRPTRLFNLAAVVPVRRVQAEPVAAMQVNAIAVINLAEALARHSPDAWLFQASTSHVYAPKPLIPGAPRKLTETSQCNPASFYGSTKLAGEHILRPLAARLSLSTCIGRIFSYFHARQSSEFLIPSLRNRIDQAPINSTLDVADATSVRDLLPAEVMIDAILYLAAARHVGTVNIGSGSGLAVGAVAEHLIEIMGKDLNVNLIASENPGALIADVRRLRKIVLEAEE